MFIRALFAESLVCVFTVVSHVVLPGKHVTGYCVDKHFQPLVYKLNGISMLVGSIVLFFVLDKDLQMFFFNNHFNCVLCANCFGLLVSFFFYVRGGSEEYARCITVDQLHKDKLPTSIVRSGSAPSAIVQFFLGCEWNPRFCKIDVKMLLYALGAIGLAINILSACATHYYHLNGQLLNGMMVYVALFMWFLFEYMYYENVHLYTYDIFAEKLGFKLAWGCMVFYPYFYCIGIYPMVFASVRHDISLAVCVVTMLLFFFGWGITRGANMQKYYFRTDPLQTSVFFGLIHQKTISGTHILCSGFWGKARHLNYLGEILQSIALSLPGCIIGLTSLTAELDQQGTTTTMQYVKLVFFACSPLLYSVYYIVLFITRQIDDDEVCKRKYGAKWDEYCNVVTWRICPGVW